MKTVQASEDFDGKLFKNVSSQFFKFLTGIPVSIFLGNQQKSSYFALAYHYSLLLFISFHLQHMTVSEGSFLFIYLFFLAIKFFFESLAS